MRRRPGRALVATLVTQQKVLQALPLRADLTLEVHPVADQIAQRFLLRVGDPQRLEQACRAQPRQRTGVAAIRLHPVAGRFRDRAGRHHVARPARAAQAPQQRIAARSRLIDESQRFTEPLGQPLDMPLHCTGQVRHHAAVFHPQAGAFTGLCRHSHRDGVLVHVEADVHR